MQEEMTRGVQLNPINPVCPPGMPAGDGKTQQGDAPHAEQAVNVLHGRVLTLHMFKRMIQYYETERTVHLIQCALPHPHPVIIPDIMRYIRIDAGQVAKSETVKRLQKLPPPTTHIKDGLIEFDARAREPGERGGNAVPLPHDPSDPIRPAEKVSGPAML